MVVSLQNWNPSIPLHAKLLRAATGARGKKFVWTEDMENEYNNIRQIMKKQIKLSPYDPDKKLRLVIDGGRTAGTGFLFIQNVDDKDIHGEHNPLRIQCTSIEQGLQQHGS